MRRMVAWARAREAGGNRLRTLRASERRETRGYEPFERAREREARDKRLRAFRARGIERGERQQVTSPSSEREGGGETTRRMVAGGEWGGGSSEISVNAST